MSQQKSADWKFSANGSVIVGEFPEGTELSGEESDLMAAEFGEPLEQPSTAAHVTVLHSSELYSSEAQENLKASAAASAEHGVTRRAIVARGTKQLTTASRVREVDAIEAETFDLDEKDEAIEWARQG